MKTKETKEIFDFLMSKFNIDKNQLVNFWDADNCAFDISNVDKTILIYISTFQKEVDDYYLEIEQQNEESQIFENINRSHLVKILQPILSS